MREEWSIIIPEWHTENGKTPFLSPASGRVQQLVNESQHKLLQRVTTLIFQTSKKIHFSETSCHVCDRTAAKRNHGICECLTSKI